MQSDAGATLHFVETSTGAQLAPYTLKWCLPAMVSTLRCAKCYPDEKVAFADVNTRRGVTGHRPILSGKSYIRIGSINTGKMVIYPIFDNIDAHGMQLVNWVAETQRGGDTMNDWNRTGSGADFLDVFKD